MTQEQILIRKSLRNGKTFTPFVEDTDIAANQKEIVSAPLWSKSQASLTAIYTSSAQSTNQKRYYYEVYNSQSNLQGAESQFSIAYGDSVGSGSSTGSATQNLYDYPTKAVYSQYRQMLLNAGDTLFTFANGETSQYIYVVNVNRARFKDRMDTKTWQLTISGSGNNYITLIDDSTASTTDLAQLGGRVHNIRSGSIANGIYTSDTTPWGLFYPDRGVLVLNGQALDASASFNTQRVPATGSGFDNAFKLFTSISGAMASDTTRGFQGRTSEVMSSTYYFVRMFNGEYNYTTNDSFISGSSGVVKYDSMVRDPQVYVTTIGLYDDNQELLAVAKLSKSVKKSFDRELVIKVKLDY
jgi:hypothetical protein